MPADDRRRSRSPRRTDKERRPRSPSPNRRNEKDRPRRSRSPDRQRAHSRSRSRSPRRRSRSPRRRAPRDPKSRSKSRSRSPRARRHRSRSASSDSGSSDVDHDSRKRKQDKDERRREKKARRKEKKEKKERKRNKAGKSGAVTGQWGQYGIINESDLYNKDAEFRTWLVEECKLNPETMSKDATKKHFAKFVEDFNTATLPHEKFYNIDVYERRMNLIRNGETLPINDSYDMNADMAAHTSRHKRSVVEHDSYLSKEQLAELRRVQNERIEAGKMKALGLEVKGTMGVRMDGSAFD